MSSPLHFGAGARPHPEARGQGAASPTPFHTCKQVSWPPGLRHLEHSLERGRGLLWPWKWTWEPFGEAIPGSQTSFAQGWPGTGEVCPSPGLEGPSQDSADSKEHTVTWGFCLLPLGGSSCLGSARLIQNRARRRQTSERGRWRPRRWLVRTAQTLGACPRWGSNGCFPRAGMEKPPTGSAREPGAGASSCRAKNTNTTSSGSHPPRAGPDRGPGAVGPRGSWSQLPPPACGTPCPAWFCPRR